MFTRAAEAWRNLNSETVGSDLYWWIALQNAAFYKDMEPLIAGYARGRTLDVGAGRLAWRGLLLKYVDSYFSVDVTTQHPGTDVLCDVTAGLPFPSESFDTVFCCSVLEHTPAPWHAFEEMGRILVGRGVAIVSLPFVLHMHDEPHDYYRFTRYGFEHLAKAAGFVVERIIVNGGLFHLVLNGPSILCAIVCRLAGRSGAMRASTRFWLALADRLDRLFGLKEVFASNHIAVLRKRGASLESAPGDTQRQPPVSSPQEWP